MRTKKIIILLALGVFTTSLQAQIKNLSSEKTAFSTIGIEGEELVDQYMFTMPGWEGSTRASLKYQSIKTYLMPPREVSEAGNPECYALAACAEFYANYKENYKVNLSPDYVSLSLPENNLSEALNFLVKNGTVSAAIMPYDSRFIPTTVRATQKYAIQNYLYLFREESKDRQKTFAVKKALMRGNPILVEMNIPSSIRNAKNMRDWSMDECADTEKSPFLIVSYDEEKSAFELLSTWGSTWGENGYLWVNYEDFGKMAEEGYVMIP